ncbi:DegT/DnrJ/EryC1/StrS aminotransferase family protein [Permianibacter sp. IMCC34836]|uniref:DegT/DnrJ/EryC1/StrS aminotransferase family protein n=1 Tax=Permianibacter fluminis TaxID=2738515 RepID=UPI00155307BB|nr:DegT/DnrJ/EryC1/StrS aminotransferase family protein [Permianibacter fluminis]NQD38055.1 DegT/DnrJ/EryC1/StrS aminotransferase family protein [Permianibacter fluminis]
MSKAIGGFFQLETAAQRPDSLWQHWLPADTVAVLTRYNARSAMHARLLALDCRRCWLPAYSCTALADAVPVTTETLFYPQDESLAPTAELFAQLQADDAVLVINYFGMPPTAATLARIQQHRHCHWFEDRAHSLAAGDSAWGDDVLYSPRKLCGVPDGGLLFARSRPTQIPGPASLPPPDHFAEPALLRLQEQVDSSTSHSFARYQQIEQAMRADDRAMSELSSAMLQSLPWRPLVQQRRQNYQFLQQQLVGISWLGELGEHTPSHFVIRHPDVEHLTNRLHQQKIYGQRHWRELAAPATFTQAHDLGQQLLSLPCDHRYDLDDMAAIVRALEPLL